MSSEPPEEPRLVIDANLLSPASPKPIHFPAPSNIPVLENMMDVGFNQTEPHMNDPAMHNTEVRPDFWRDPNEQPDASVGVAASGEHAGESLTEEAAAAATESEARSKPQATLTPEGADSMDTSPIAESSEPPPIVSTITTAADGHVSTDGVHDAIPTSNVLQAPSEPQVLAAQDLLPKPEPDAPQSALDGAAGDPAPGAQPLPGSIDVQALLDTLRVPPVTSTPVDPSVALPIAANPQTDNDSAQIVSHLDALPPGGEGSTPLSAAGLGIPPTGLPPRPPPQEQPLINPNYVHSQHIRDYHPHAAHPAFQPHGRSGSQGNIADPTSRNHVPAVHSPTPASATVDAKAANLAGALVNPSPGALHSTAPVNGHAFPASPASAAALASSQAPFAAQWAPAPGTEPNQESTARGGDRDRPEDRPWDAEVQRKYDRFLEDERKYVSEGRWEQFPQGSRLFVGNLSSEKVTKRDIFHVFHCYGELAQISIKQAYGFVQFLRAEDCVRSLEAEQGTQIRDKRIHLEVSKPQRNRNSAGTRRSRSPVDHARGRSGGNVDRYVSSGSRGGQARGGRNEYRPGYRSPSPRGYRDRYDDRFRPRSRSPADYGRGGRNRSPMMSPRRDEDDDLPLPRRAPADVPDVQILVLDSLDRDFISWVEKAFSARGVRVDVLILSPRLSEQAVVRRQILEGVVAVVKLTRQTQNIGKIGLQIFDRRQGGGNVKFEEYENLDPPICAELVMRAKGTHAAPAPGPAYGAYGMPPAPQYGVPSGGYQHQHQGSYGGQQAPMPSNYPPNYGSVNNRAPAAVPPAGVPPNLQSLITNLDPNNLQNLLSAMNTPQSAASYGGASAVLQNSPALAGYLQQQQQQQQVAAPAQSAGGTAGGAPQPGQHINMQDILARLGTYQQ